MKTPPFLLFAALLFWGWQSGLLLAGAGAGVALEAALLVKWRWELDDSDFNRIWGFCVLVVVAAAAYVFTTNDLGGGVAGLFHGASVHNDPADSTPTTATVLRWLPLAFLPLIVAQTYNLRSSVPLTTLSLVLRRRERLGRPGRVVRHLDVSYPYFMACVFAAGAHSNQASPAYFWGGSLLILWALWALRTRRFGIKAWAGTLAAVVALGFFGQLGLGRAERMIQDFDVQWMAKFFRSRTDPTQSATAIGQIGNLKLSPRIVIRLEPRQVGMAPAYLREASYRNYGAKNQTWYAGGGLNDFQRLLAEPDNSSWVLVPGKPVATTVSIACYLNGRSRDGDPEGVLPLPSGCGRLEHLPMYASIIELQANKTGAVLATGSGLMIFDACYGPGATLDSPPDTGTNRFDLQVPTNEIPALQTVAAEMNITGASDAEKRRAVEVFFLSKFTYSTWQGPEKRATNATPLTRFLLNSRSGHCEYFATATVLLLRQLGIPARYAVGYAVHETSGSGYVVRERDAHAWCLVWNREKNIWEDFDTTPASWIAMEGRHSAFGDWVSDVRSWLGFQIAKFRWRQAQLRQYILWTLVPVMVVLLYYIIFRRKPRARAAKKDPASAAAAVWPGRDSAFYRIEKILAARSRPRPPGEPLSCWLERVLAEPALAGLKAPLHELLRLHYRCRFDPDGLNQTDELMLKQKTEAVIKTFLELESPAVARHQTGASSSRP